MGIRLERAGHFGGSLLLFYAILYAWAPHIDTVAALALSLVAATVAAAMSLKQDEDMKVLWGIFHRTWITHSLFTVLVATVGSYLLFDTVLMSGPLSLYIAIAVFSATMSHVLLDSLTKKGVPLYGPLDNTMRGLRWFRSSNVILNYAFLAAGALMALFYYRII